jgi:glycerol uptake facilitator-like aquaporin
MDGTRAALLIAVQLLGALIAGLVVRGLFRDDVLAAARMGSPHLKGLAGPDGVTLAALVSGAGVELLLTAVVALAAFATLVDPRAPRLGGVVVGLAQVAAVLFGFHLTGGAANPAWWVGTAPWQLTLGSPAVAQPLGDHFVYWAGPVLGALAAGMFYTFVIQPGDRK